MSSTKDIELFDRYLHQQMNDQEIKEFESRLKNNDQLKEDFHLHRDAIKTIKSEKNKELKSFFQNIDNENKDRLVAERPTLPPEDKIPKAKVFNLTKLLSSIAAALIVLVAATFLFRSANSTNYSDQYFSPYPNTIVKLERSSDESTELQDIMRMYQQKNYEAAIPKFKEFLQANPNDDVTLYLAIAQLANGDHEASINNLKRLTNIAQYEYKDAAYWYLALSYLEDGQKENAKNILSEIISRKQEFKKKETEEILKSI